MITITRHDTQELKQFALMMSWAFPAVFALLLPWLFGHSVMLWPFAVSVVMLSLHVVYPRGIYYPYRAWMAIALVLGWINTRIILAAVFFLLITPFGLLARAVGKLQYRRTPVKPDSNWGERKPGETKQELERPF
ncbi:SxtJ family membrane protein [Aestuariibacter salexigens]|uniref:SxtJ family membrane protein n=1 Tax=Aestuariibacter salexigens TaxID=226010 RepID=UPI0003FB6F60|nr:SxtJ family membrane protein [Aestuariibacter salexigens]